MRLPALLLILMAAAALAQPAEFEVASVKQLEKGIAPGQMDLSFVGTAGKPFKISGDRVTITGTLHALIRDAYSVKTYQISALPDWADSLLFSITAKAPGDDEVTQDQARVMLQALLAERFQLKFRRESKEMPVYRLIHPKTSKAFTPAGENETFSWKLTNEPGGILRSKATKESIGDFVQLVGVSTDRPVIDKTGIDGFIDYDIRIEQNGVKSNDDLNRAIVDAVIDQLGLKLESTKDKVDLLVIERAEKPGAN